MKQRIAKFIADSGAASRRGAEQLIAASRVAVNGAVLTTPAFFVDDGDVVTLDGRVVAPRGHTEIYMFHKPLDTMTTAHDPMGRRTIYDCMPQEYRGLRYVGRLDYKTTGLLLMTNDGAVARKLTLPSSNMPRTYIARVDNPDIKRLAPARRGMTVDGVKYRPMDIEQISSDEFRVTVTEGKKNEIRIVLRACGCPVRQLHRVSFGPVALGNLGVGKIIKLPQKTIDAIVKNL